MEGATASNSSSDKRCQNNASFYTKSFLRDFFTVLALSFHAVFEGLAVGLETDSKDVWLLFAGKLVTIEMVIFAYFQFKEGGWVRKFPKTCSHNLNGPVINFNVYNVTKRFH